MSAGPISELIIRLREHYESLEAEPRPGVSPEALAAFEAEHDLRLPDPMRELYLALDGLDGEVPEFGFNALQLWPLAELTRVSEGVAECRGIPDYGPILDVLPYADQYLAFGDAMCWSHVVAARLTRAAPVLWISGSRFTQVGVNFSDFWERYLATPASVLWPEF